MTGAVHTLPSEKCPECLGRKLARYPRCWRCQVDRLIKQAHQTGYEEGYDAALKEFDLVHPDTPCPPISGVPRDAITRRNGKHGG